MEDKLKLKNGRELKVTFTGVEGATQEEIDQVWNDIFNVLERAGKKKEELDKEESASRP
jgi:hypothetical protein